MAVVATVVGLFGLFIGSFLNVCIWRLPQEEQVVLGRSRCPACGQMIAWYDNVPLISFVRLGGRCRQCRAPISWRYPVVEALTGVGLAAVVLRWGLTPVALVYASLVASLIVIAFIDAKEQIIPDEVTIPGILIGLVSSLVWPVLQGATSRGPGLLQSVLGAVVGAGAIYGMGLLGRLLFKKEAMGLGDVKLMGMLGALLGWQKVLLVFFLAPFFGSLVGVPLRLLRKQELLPYGPFLSVAAILVLWWGDAALVWYGRLMGGS